MADFTNVTTGALDGDGYFDLLMRTLKLHLEDALTDQLLTQSDVGAAYIGIAPTMVKEAINFELREQLVDEQVVAAKIKNEVDDAIKADKIATSASALVVTEATAEYKISLSKNNSDSILANINMTKAKQKGLEEQVIDNRYIKAIESVSDTYSTFGAGGLTVSQDQWSFYYNLIGNLVEDLRDFKGNWDATTAFQGDTDGLYGDFWVVTVNGNVEVDGISDWVAGDATRNPDIVYYDGAKWKKISGATMDTTVTTVA